MSRSTPLLSSVHEKITRHVASVALAALLAAPASAQLPCGDCNGDTVISVLDALLAAQHGVGLVVLTGESFRRCDMDGDTDVDVLDGLLAAQEAVLLQPSLTCLPLPLPAGQLIFDGHFATGLVCSQCHSNSAGSTAMRDDLGNPVGFHDLWRSTMMASAARDPLWRAQVSAEVAATPAARAAIEAKCLTCHAPMAFTQAHLSLEPPHDMAIITQDTPRGQIALDGVSCALCHQIDDDLLGTPASFDGGFVINTSYEMLGPHDNQFGSPMVSWSGFLPLLGAHVSESALCATCHNLTTQTLDSSGTPTGHSMVEQSPYSEWQNSLYNDELPFPGLQAASCAECHLLTVSELGVPISTRIARNPSGGDFGPVAPRSPYGRHLLAGGNTFMLSVLRDQAADLQPVPSATALDTTIAVTMDQLQNRTATVLVDPPTRVLDELTVPVRVGNLTGHRFPASFPSRRAWIEVRVTDQLGAQVFASGLDDGAGVLVDGAGVELPVEAVGGPIAPHHELITSDAQAQIYEPIMADPAGQPTFTLLRGASYLKDNRILPAGWDPLHPLATAIAPVGVGADPDYSGGILPGEDSILYRFDAPLALGPYTITVRLRYQTLSTRWARELLAVSTGEVRAMRNYHAAADRTPVVVDEAIVVLP